MLISVLFLAANFCNSEIVESAGNMMLVNFLTDNEGDGKNWIPVVSFTSLDFL